MRERFDAGLDTVFREAQSIGSVKWILQALLSALLAAASASRLQVFDILQK